MTQEHTTLVVQNAALTAENDSLRKQLGALLALYRRHRIRLLHVQGVIDDLIGEDDASEG